ncbi:MBL fold metallo-hydrolase [Halomonas daqingensis]|uniref:MBL fold metallo-hydrolase n=1 Tax=Billgrantia desiderata TaxID=52021 RepID=A0AAW4YT88_9GAMM|nr:MBL fold metallo-hydrolase [Halomonas desiderata]MCE8045061.1 MBL fold metallo-hydrolase [Halomonas desiderata]MCE8049640.1 MBL fold metallo-hydrolase [Halomonas desiderata]MCE8051242.1 MBL fold metallo-hydrolase [Halomonas desiderata]
MSHENNPTMLHTLEAGSDWHVLPAFLPLPGMGGLAINAFLHKGSEPVLVDTGLAALGDSFLDALEAEIDLTDLRWIWLSHTDADHIGNLSRILERAPKARVVTSFLGMGKMGLLGLDVSRVHLLEPGARLTLGDRELVPLRPPYYDAPETLGFFDTRSRTLFAADSFGALLPQPAGSVREIATSTLRDGLVAWSAIDAPWLATADRAALGRALHGLERLAPTTVLSGHLPVAEGGVEELTAMVHSAWCSGPGTGIDPQAIETVAEALGDAIGLPTQSAAASLVGSSR